MIQFHEFSDRFYAQLFVAAKGVVKIYRYEEPWAATAESRLEQIPRARRRAFNDICTQAQRDGLSVLDVLAAERYPEIATEKRRV